jgi:hypothetical protein
MRSSSRYIHMLIAAIAGVALAFTSITAASASALRDHAEPSVSAPATVNLQSLPSGTPKGLKLGQPVIVHVNAHASGIVGYAICLYNSQNNCASDTATFADRNRSSNVIEEILAYIGDGITVWTIIKAAHNSYKWLKKYVYKGKHIYTGKGDGLCMADFGYNQTASLADCGDRHGIYWQYQTTGKIWNTFAKGDLISSSLASGTHLFVHSTEDWSTWAFRAVCVNSC